MTAKSTRQSIVIAATSLLLFSGCASAMAEPAALSEYPLPITGTLAVAGSKYPCSSTMNELSLASGGSSDANITEFLGSADSFDAMYDSMRGSLTVEQLCAVFSDVWAMNLPADELVPALSARLSLAEFEGTEDICALADSHADALKVLPHQATVEQYVSGHCEALEAAALPITGGGEVAAPTATVVGGGSVTAYPGSYNLAQ